MLQSMGVGHTRTSTSSRMYLLGLFFLAIIACSQGLFYTNSDKNSVPNIGRRSEPLSDEATQDYQTGKAAQRNALKLSDILGMAFQPRKTNFRKDLDLYQLKRDGRRRGDAAEEEASAVPSEDFLQFLTEGFPEHERRHNWNNQGRHTAITSRTLWEIVRGKGTIW